MSGCRNRCGGVAVVVKDGFEEERPAAAAAAAAIDVKVAGYTGKKHLNCSIGAARNLENERQAEPDYSPTQTVMVKMPLTPVEFLPLFPNLSRYLNNIIQLISYCTFVE